MATMTTVTLVDDLDGSEASESVSFALDGASYEIDLSDGNADKLRNALAGYVASARRVDGGRRGPGRPKTANKPAQGRPGPAYRAGSRADRRYSRVGPRQRPRGVRARSPVGQRPRRIRGSSLIAAPPGEITRLLRPLFRSCGRGRSCLSPVVVVLSALDLRVMRPLLSPSGALFAHGVASRSGGTRPAGGALNSSDGTVRSVVTGP